MEGMLMLMMGGVKALAASADKTATYMNMGADQKLSALEESQRRAEGRQTQVLSSTKARMAGTGFDSGSGSYTDYLNAMATEFSKQNNFQQKKGLEQVSLMREAASDADTAKWLNVLGMGAQGATQAASDLKVGE